jgi:hypothetical protein
MYHDMWGDQDFLTVVFETLITELSGIWAIEKCLYFGVRRISAQMSCSRRRHGKSSEWLAQLCIRVAVAHHLFFFLYDRLRRPCLPVVIGGANNTMWVI